MARELDQILVIDVEATCWEKKPPAGQESEIIEIGVCQLAVTSGEMTAAESILIKPQRSTVSSFCTRLTTLTQAEVETGIPFSEACRMLQNKYRAKQCTWASYGDYDRHQFERQCRRWQIGYPFGPTHLNIKNLVALIHRLPHEVGMAEALALLDLPLQGTHHRAADDARNITAILSKLLYDEG